MSVEHLTQLIRDLWAGTHSPTQGSSRGEKNAIRPTLQILEDRTMPATNISGVAFVDFNRNDIRNSNDTVLRGATVSLRGNTDAGVQVSRTFTTTEGGRFNFINLAQGTYTLTATSPTGLRVNLESNTSTSPQIRIREGQTILEDLSFPVVNGSGVISGVTFIDSNGNLTFNGGEQRVQGSTVSLTGTTDQGVAINTQVITKADGSFLFDNVMPGTYRLRATAQGLLGTSVDGISVYSTLIHVTGGLIYRMNLGFAGVKPRSISLTQFLSNSGTTSFPRGDAGSGIASVSFRENNKPTAETIPTQNVGKNAGSTILDLAGFFGDDDFTNSQIRFVTNKGSINVELFDEKAPQTVANFFNYILSNRYDNTIFHRHATNFVIQGGGFKFDANTNPKLTRVQTDPAVKNEYGDPNTLGTIAMAKSPGNANSATSEFFFNLKNNTTDLGPTNNGGFTVFGKIIGQSDQATINAITAMPIVNKSTFNSALNTLPLQGNAGTNFPANTVANNYAFIQDVVVVKRDEFLTYNVVSNTDSSLVQASIIDNRLTLRYTPGATGTARITLRGTDRFGASVTTSFNVNVANQPPIASVVLNNTSPTTNGTLTATVTKSDPNNDTVRLNYVWKKKVGNADPVIVKQTLNTTSTTDTLDLSQAGNGNKGDQITVEVTPSDGSLNGTLATATATVINSVPTLGPLTVTPGNPTTNATLTASVQSASDADGDAVTLTYVWKVNGSVVKSTPATTSLTDTLDLSIAGNGNKGNVVTVEVTPNDGTASGTALTSSQITIQNSAPVLGPVTVTPTDPTTNTELTATTTVTDDDGDPVTLSYQWYVNDVPVGSPTVTTNLSDTFKLDVAGHGDKGDIVKVVITPNDGTVNGADGASDPITILNSAPVATTIGDQTFSGAGAFHLDVSGNFSDPDGDSLTFIAVLNDGNDSPLPAWLSFTDAGVFDGDPAPGDEGVLDIKVFATDTQGATASTTFTLTLSSLA